MSGLHPRRALPPTLPAGSRAVGHVGPTYAGRSDPVEPPTRSSDNASAGSRAVGRVGPTYASRPDQVEPNRPEEHTSELQSLIRNSYAVFCLKQQIYLHVISTPL